eukprot:scaffold104_cov99-Phaeocystis_antarctica.AAC.2
MGVQCPSFSAHFRGTIWSPRPKQRRCPGTNGTESTGGAKKTGLEPLDGGNGVPFVGSNHTQEYNLNTTALGLSFVLGPTFSDGGGLETPSESMCNC